MKHKQIRQNVYETNSSSTCAYTLSFYSSKQPNHKPIISGPIKVGNWANTYEDWTTKLQMLAGYLTITKQPLDFLISTVEKFSGDKLEFVIDDKLKDSSLEDYFDSFSYRHDYDYGNTVEDIESIMTEVLSSEENILKFLFVNGQIDVNEYYDG